MSVQRPRDGNEDGYRMSRLAYRTLTIYSVLVKIRALVRMSE